MKKQQVNVKGTEVTIIMKNDIEYISLTNIAAKFGEPRFVVRNWLRNISNLNYLGLWEEMHNDDFNRVGFSTVKKEISDNPNGFSISPAIIALEKD
jgi:hypothetical protein